MKYNLTTDLSATTFESYAKKLKNKEESDFEIDFQNCLFFETDQVLNASKKPPAHVKDMKYIYARWYKPYELFTYPYGNLHFHGRLGGGRVHAITVESNDMIADTISSKVVETNEISADEGTIKSVNVTSITATSPTLGISSELGIVDNISGDILHYDNGKFDTISATGKADLVAAAAKWADVAELYYGDDHYEPGTLVKFGGLNELTLATDYANGCISEKPAVLMNTVIRKYINSVPLLLTGKTRVKVNGPIEKFDRIELSDIPGVARKHTDRQLLGIALESNENAETKLVECIIRLTI